MSMPIPGSEAFSSRPVDPEELRRSLPSALSTHTVSQEQVDGLDPLTYEVIRHRLWSITDEMGEALKRMSGSPIVTDANDFDFALCDELGQEVQVGLYNTMLVGAVDLAIYWTLRNRAANPGIAEGDMFLCNDPWVGGGLHQNDVIVYQPVFHDGQLFAWTSAVAHQPDLGGVGLGSFSPAAQDVFSESLPTPPVKVVRDGQLQRDVADLWVRRSRVPMLIALDLRAKIGANNVGGERIHALIDQYGADTVKAVMKRMMDDAESRLRGKLASLPDGRWSATGYQDQSHEGDRGLHKITVTMTKTGDHLTFDFTGTDPQAGVINCTYAGMRGGVMLGAAAHPGQRHPVVRRWPDALLRPGHRGGHAQQRHVPGRGQPGPDRPGLAHRQPGRGVPVPDAGPVPGTGQERPGHLLRDLGHRGHRRPGRARRGARPVPQHHHGADGRRVRRPAARRRDRHRRPVLHPAGPRPRRGDDRVPLPGAHPVAAGGAGQRRSRPSPGRRRCVGGVHPARHQPAHGAHPGLGGQGRRAERRAVRRPPRQHRPGHHRPAEPGRGPAGRGPAAS